LLGSLFVSKDRALAEIHEEVAALGGRENPYMVPKAQSRIKVDGLLDENAWENAVAMELPFEWSASYNASAPVRTEVLLIHDEENAYFGFRCHDPDVEAIRAYYADHDAIGMDDWVAINIDTFNDERRSFSYAVNPLGVQWDAVRTERLKADTSWDGIWESMGSIADWGYTVEIAIPFSSVSFQRAGGPQVWGFDAWRAYPRKVNYRTGIVPLDRDDNCYHCRLIKVKGFEGVTPGRNIEITPTLTTVRTDARPDFPLGNLEKEYSKTEAGLTTYWGLTPNLTFSGTINPDFSQVEADALQLDINRPFALFFQEKRPFFTEGKDLFESEVNAVYTRSMRAPSWGLKLTGKEGANTIGAYVVRDQVTNLIFPGKLASSATSIPFENTSSVFRYKRDLGSKYTLGTLVTSREGEEYFNRVLGFDGDFRFTERNRIVLQYIGSSTRYPATVAEGHDQQVGKFDDSAFAANYTYDSRSLSGVIKYRDIGPDFRSDLGFVPRTDYRWLTGWLDYYWYGKSGSWWSKLNLGGGFDYTRDHSGVLLDLTRNIWLSFDGSMQSWLLFRVMSNREMVPNGRLLDIKPIVVAGSFRPADFLYVELRSKLGDGIDYENSRKARKLHLSPELTFTLNRHLKLDFNHTFERLSLDEGAIYTANISEARLVYQFNRRAFVRAILQHIDYDRNTELYMMEVEPEFKKLFTRFLFTYKINPRTALYMGYSDNYYAGQAYHFIQFDRTFFAKIGYAWLL
jgi:hypothetical protein